MKVQVEFFGVARLITGEKGVSLPVEHGATVGTLVRQLRDCYPQLVGDVIQRDGLCLQEPNVFHFKGKPLNKCDSMAEKLNDGDNLVLMSLSAGG